MRLDTKRLKENKERGCSDGAVNSIEAEQQLLGAIMENNDAFDRIEKILDFKHFYDPLHGFIFSAVSSLISKGVAANPSALGEILEGKNGLEQLGGTAYLQSLADSAASTHAVMGLAKKIYDLAIRRQLLRISKDIAHKASKLDIESNPDELVLEAEQALHALAEKDSDQGLEPVQRAVTFAINVTNKALQMENGLGGLSTGFLDLDGKLGGLHKSDLVIIAGRPSMGKTSLAANIAFNIAKAHKESQSSQISRSASTGGVVGFFSLEMSSEQLAARILADAAEVTSENIRRGDLTEAEFRRFVEAAKVLEACSLFIDDTPALPINQLKARARRLKRTHGLDVLIVDYLQLLRGSDRYESRAVEISEITMGLKAIAKELSVPVIALSQLSRQVENREDKRPTLSDLRESGSIEQDADIILFVFREEYYREREKPSDHRIEDMAAWQEEMQRLHGKAEIIIGKQRNGSLGTVELSFEAKFTRFGNLTRVNTT